MRQEKSSSLKYTIVVMGPVYGTQSASCAYQFCHTLLNETAHKIKTIFFYADGVYNANSFTDPANDEFNLLKAWQTLTKQHLVNLAVCISAAQRRGITSQHSKNNIADGFQLVGLGELSESLAESDRVINF